MAQQQTKQEENVETIRNALARFAEGDVDAVLRTLADDIEIVSQGPKGATPWAGTYRGREGAERFFAAYDAVEYERFEPLEFVASGDQVAVRGVERWRAKPTGATCEQEWVVLFTMRGGRATRMRVFEDTASVQQATGGRAAVDQGVAARGA